MSGRSRAQARQGQRRRWIFIATAFLATGVLVGFVVMALGQEPAGTVEVTMTDYAFSPTVIHVASGEQLHIVNDGELIHSFLIPDLGKGIELLPGDEGTLALPASAAGTHRVICDIVGHVDAGMVATIEIA